MTLCSKLKVLKVLIYCIGTVNFHSYKVVSPLGNLSLTQLNHKSKFRIMKQITKPVAEQSEEILLDDNSYAKSTLGNRRQVSAKEQNVY